MEIPKKSDKFLDGSDNRCRVCLLANDDNKCIFASPMTEDREDHSWPTLWDKLQLHGGIELANNDGLPKKLCNNCISRLFIAHDFRMQCQETDKKLRAMQKEIRNDRGLKEEDDEQIKEIDESKVSEKSMTKTTLNGPWRIRQNLNFANSSNTAKSTNPEKAKENNSIMRRESRRSRRLMIVKKSSSEKFCKPYEIISEKSIASPENEISKTTLENLENAKSKVSRLSNTNLPSKSESLRSRRLVAFKRITSMENLKNRKLRQRQYMKKKMFPKDENKEQEITQNINKNREAPAQQVPSNLTILPYQCTKCYRSCSTEKSFQEHQQSHENKKFCCDQCDERFVKLAEYLQHAKSHELNEKLKPANCWICNKNFRKYLTMVRHLHVHKRDDPLAVYVILKDIRDKRKSNNSKFFIENIPIFDESRKVYLENREKNFVALEKSFKIETSDELPTDDRSAIKLINIWIKEELDYDIEGKGFPCQNCSKSYVTKNSLIKHMKKMHENCEFCIGKCDCPERKYENDDEPEKSKAYSCSECEESFDEASKLKKHSKIHGRKREDSDKNFKRFLCHICSKTFRQNTGLMFHMRTHTGYKPHVCKYCGRGFTSNSNCTNHERTHTGDRPFICHFCSAAFAKSCTLKAHITTHTGEANYHCKTCGKSFRRLKYLKEHRFTHTGEKPYACKTCGTAYSHSGSLFVHEKKCKAQRDNRRDTGDYYTEGFAIEGNNLRMNLENLNTKEQTNFTDGIQGINEKTIIENIDSNSSNLPNSISKPQTFTIIEQTFHT